MGENTCHVQNLNVTDAIKCGRGQLCSYREKHVSIVTVRSVHNKPLKSIVGSTLKRRKHIEQNITRSISKNFWSTSAASAAKRKLAYA